MLRRLLLPLALCAVVAAVPAAQPASDPASVAAVLDAHRAASGAPPAAGTVHTVYAYSGQGLEGQFESRHDIRTGRYLSRAELGPVQLGNGYDGRLPWMRDLSGAHTPQEGGDRIRLAINQAYRNANLWWRADRGGAAIRHLGQETEGERRLHHLVVEPRGGLAFDAWFDAETHLLARIAERQMFFDTRADFLDYRRVQGLMLPGRILNDGGTGPANVETMTLIRAEIGRALAPAAYARPTAPPPGGHFEGGGVARLPFRLLNNHIYVEARVNGRGPYTFIVDTGGHTLLSSRLIDELGLRSQGAAPSAGAGEKTETSGYVPVRDIALGPVHLRDQVGIAQDIYEPVIEGLRVDGMLGFELFRRFAVVIDYGRLEMRLQPFERFDAAGLGTMIPFTFYDHVPQVAGSIDGRPARLAIDTGSRSEVDLTSPFVAAQGLLARQPDALEALTGWGVGGAVRSRVVRLDALALGPMVVERPVAALSQARAGSFSDGNYDGNIGSGLLKRFVVSFDYSRQRMYLKRIEPPVADAGTFDRAGVWLNGGEGGGLVAMQVIAGAPAAEAGLQAGDRIVAVDGRPVQTAELPAVRQRLRDPLQQQVRLSVQRGGESLELTVRLRDLLAPAKKG